jgi:hypothetical protein
MSNSDILLLGSPLSQTQALSNAPSVVVDDTPGEGVHPLSPPSVHHAHPLAGPRNSQEPVLTMDDHQRGVFFENASLQLLEYKSSLRKHLASLVPALQTLVSDPKAAKSPAGEAVQRWLAAFEQESVKGRGASAGVGMSGWLKKLSARGVTAKRRWVVLDGTRLIYYGDKSESDLKGVLQLTGARLHYPGMPGAAPRRAGMDLNGLKLAATGGRYYFCVSLDQGGGGGVDGEGAGALPAPLPPHTAHAGSASPLAPPAPVGTGGEALQEGAGRKERDRTEGKPDTGKAEGGKAEGTKEKRSLGSFLFGRGRDKNAAAVAAAAAESSSDSPASSVAAGSGFSAEAAASSASSAAAGAAGSAKSSNSGSGGLGDAHFAAPAPAPPAIAPARGAVPSLGGAVGSGAVLNPLHKSKTLYVLVCATAAEREQWVLAIQQAIAQAAKEVECAFWAARFTAAVSRPEYLQNLRLLQAQHKQFALFQQQQQLQQQQALASPGVSPLRLPPPSGSGAIACPADWVRLQMAATHRRGGGGGGGGAGGSDAAPTGSDAGSGGLFSRLLGGGRDNISTGSLNAAGALSGSGSDLASAAGSASSSGAPSSLLNPAHPLHQQHGSSSALGTGSLATVHEDAVLAPLASPARGNTKLVRKLQRRRERMREASAAAKKAAAGDAANPKLQALVAAAEAAEHIYDMSRAAVAAAEASAIRRRAGYVPGDRVNMRQLSKDYQRDVVMLGGERIAGADAAFLVSALALRIVRSINSAFMHLRGEGYTPVAGDLLQLSRSADSNTAMSANARVRAFEAQLLEYAREILLCSSRTVAGGDTYDALELVFRNPDRVVLIPDTATESHPVAFNVYVDHVAQTIHDLGAWAGSYTAISSAAASMTYGRQPRQLTGSPLVTTASSPMFYPENMSVNGSLSLDTSLDHDQSLLGIGTGESSNSLASGTGASASHARAHHHHRHHHGPNIPSNLDAVEGDDSNTVLLLGDDDGGFSSGDDIGESLDPSTTVQINARTTGPVRNASARRRSASSLPDSVLSGDAPPSLKDSRSEPPPGAPVSAAAPPSRDAALFSRGESFDAKETASAFQSHVSPGASQVGGNDPSHGASEDQAESKTSSLWSASKGPQAVGSDRFQSSQGHGLSMSQLQQQQQRQSPQFDTLGPQYKPQTLFRVPWNLDAPSNAADLLPFLVVFVETKMRYRVIDLDFDDLEDEGDSVSVANGSDGATLRDGELGSITATFSRMFPWDKPAPSGSISLRVDATR